MRTPEQAAWAAAGTAAAAVACGARSGFNRWSPHSVLRSPFTGRLRQRISAPAGQDLGFLLQLMLRRFLGQQRRKYRPAGARNRPAACNRGIPGTRLSVSTDPPGDPASRTRHTPEFAHAASTSSVAGPLRATGIPASRPTAGWACASTRPGTTYRPGSCSASGIGSVTRHPASFTHRSTRWSPSGSCTAHTVHGT